jgi:macrodomain Ter protein organizer (MatP/YcbG family)
MSKENMKKISAVISQELWKKIKILSVQREISLSQQITSLLERSVSNKKIETTINEEI